MALPDGVAGGGRRGITITLAEPDGSAIDLSGASGVTGTITTRGDAPATRAIAGTLSVFDASTGKVRWAFDATDLVAGSYLVQLTVSYASGLPDRTFAEPWSVRDGYTAA